MGFRKAIKSIYRIRNAKLDDSDYISEIQVNYLEDSYTYESPKPPERFRLVIGSSTLSNERIIIIEDPTKILGFIEQKTINPYLVRLSYPFVRLDH
ncbi:MAG: hypothetical protein ACC656_14530, partial [Candidatus Heimdallarchaeota archaeon]